MKLKLLLCSCCALLFGSLSSNAQSLIPFLRDLLCLEIRSLSFLRQNLTSAGREGPAIRTVLDSYQATVGLLDLAGTLFRTAGLQIPAAPTLSGSTDTGSLSADDAAMKDFIAVLTIAADSLWDAKHVTAGARSSSQLRKLSIGFFIGSAA